MNSYSTSWWSLGYYSLIDPLRMKGWVGLVSWPTAGGFYTHINGYKSAAGPMQTSENSPVRDVLPQSQPTNTVSQSFTWWLHVCLALLYYIHCMSKKTAPFLFLTWVDFNDSFTVVRPTINYLHADYWICHIILKYVVALCCKMHSSRRARETLTHCVA